jgi:hypothetical protein
MSDSQDFSITPVGAVGNAAPVQPVAADRPAVHAVTHDAAPTPQRHEAAAATSGNLQPAVAQFIINPDTHDVVIRVKDPNSGQVLSEYPSQEVEAMEKYMRQYADTAARLRVSRNTEAAN